MRSPIRRSEARTGLPREPSRGRLLHRLWGGPGVGHLPRRRQGLPRLTSHWVGVESFQYLGHPSPADAKMAGKCGPALELARVKGGLIVAELFLPALASLWR